VTSSAEHQLDSALDEIGCLGVRLREDHALREALSSSAAACVQCLRRGGKMLLAGNGGSAAQAQHIACELIGRFALIRPGLSAMALTTDSAVLTALANDLGYEQVFARQVEALGATGDVLLVFSTSGNSPNILRALEAARSLGMCCIGFAGAGGGAMAARCDLLLEVPSGSTPRIQEFHLLLGHALCATIESALFDGSATQD
jgi:D-sedoheptulose 7-phosphate isomerase